MREAGCTAVVVLLALLGCERTEPSRPSMAGASPDAGPVVARDPSGDAVRPASPTPAATSASSAGKAESLVRQRIGPLVRFQLVPVGSQAVGLASAALPSLRQRYVGYGFALGATLETLPPSAVDCASFLRTLVGARGTLFILASPLRCADRFGALDRRISAAVVLLPPLGVPGSPEAARRLTALLSADVGEILGLSYPCTQARGCCPLRTAPDLSVFDARAAASCPQHAAELGTIGTDAGLQ